MRCSRLKAVSASFVAAVGIFFFTAVGSSRAEERVLTFSKAQYWCSSFSNGPRLPMVGDADGDGHADLLALYPLDDSIVDVTRTSPFGKPTYNQQARTGFGRNPIAVTSGEFTGQGRADVLGVFADGVMRLAHGMERGATHYAFLDEAGRCRPDAIPKAPTHTLTGDFDGDGRLDALIVDADDRLWLLHNEKDAAGKVQFSCHACETKLTGWKQISAGDLTGRGRAELVWLDATGQVYRAALTLDKEGRVQREAPLLVTQAPPEAHLIVGRFRGEKQADLLVGQRLLPGGDAAHAVTCDNLPTVAEARGDGFWLVGDFNGDGMDDLLRIRRSGERFTGEDLYIHYPSYPDDADKGFVSTCQDGLPDAWKTGRVKPAGMDLAALGCSPQHHDVIVEIERFTDLPVDRLKDELMKVQRYFASLPIANPDGNPGVAMHFILKPPHLLKERDELMAHFDDHFPPRERSGIVHSMFIEEHGPLVSQINGTRGHCNLDPATFIHEFGHQMNLSHEAWYGPPYCAFYPSLMSYTYAYGLNDRYEDIGYSDGARAGIVLHEEHLNERIPLPYNKVKFLAGGPYRFHLKPTADGKATLVDWNWNGIFGEADVAADVNYERGTDVGARFDVGRSYTAPVLTTYGEGAAAKLLLFSGTLSPGANPPPPTAQAKSPSLSPDFPGGLTVRVWQGRSRDQEGGVWSDETVVAAAGVTGDPSAVFLENATWVVYPTREGAVLRKITLTPDARLQIGETIPIPNSQGTQPTLSQLGDRLALLLWRDPQTPVGLRLIVVDGPSPVIRREVAMDFASEVPVGVIGGPEEKGEVSFWIGRIESTDPEHKLLTQVRRYILGRNGVLRPAEQEWVNGVYSLHRMTLLWSPEPMANRNGRLYHLSGGVVTPQKPWAEQYITMQTAYLNEGGGWQYRKYYDDSYLSRSAPGACLFQGNIVYALRLFDPDPKRNDVVSIGFHGNGAGVEPMGDFDDIGFIRDFGLRHSIAMMSN